MCKKTVVKKAVKFHFDDVYAEMEEEDNRNYDLDKIEAPEDNSLSEALKNAVAQAKDIKALKAIYDREYNGLKTAALKAEFASLCTLRKGELDALFNMRLDGEIDKEQYEDKKAQIQLEIERANDKIKAHGKADDGFNETLLGLFKIASAAAEIFYKSDDMELKRLLLRFVFDGLYMKESTVCYKLKFPFSQMEESSNGQIGGNDAGNSGNSCEPLSDKAFGGISSSFSNLQNSAIRTAKSQVKTKACNIKLQACSNWLPHMDSNHD